jgi:hypothetical protein
MTPEDAVAAYQQAIETAAGHVYALDGDLEANMATDAGRLVEVVGMLAGPRQANPEGSLQVDALPEINVIVWHPVGDFCPAS